VNAIEFNPNKPTLLASGGKEVYIQDLSKNIQQPTVFTPGEPNYHEGSTVTSISWNRVVPYILASASNDGTVVVWDLKNSKAIFNFKDPDLVSYTYNPLTGQTEEKVSANYNIVWNPTAPTTFLISNDNGENSTMAMWDLRTPDYPVLSLSDIHNDGITSTSWCPHDPSIVASTSREGRTCYFHAEDGQLLAETPKKYSEINWSPHIQGKLIGYDEETNNTEFIDFDKAKKSESATHVPKWLTRPGGACFGFGGKLVTFNNNQLTLRKVEDQTDTLS